jgi:hypothetical protein
VVEEEDRKEIGNTSEKPKKFRIVAIEGDDDEKISEDEEVNVEWE